jgi:hypothetical protein
MDGRAHLEEKEIGSLFGSMCSHKFETRNPHNIGGVNNNNNLVVNLSIWSKLFTIPGNR